MSTNKDFIINLRVSRATYDKIKRKARENSETISNLVRKAIEDSSEILADLSEEVFGKASEDKLKDIASYHKVQLAQNMDCARCGKKLMTGEMVVCGETAIGRRYYLCPTCK